jgi:hypothetical protein
LPVSFIETFLRSTAFDGDRICAEKKNF